MGNAPEGKTKCAIVGFAPDSRAEVAQVFDDPEFAVYGINELYLEKDMQDILLPPRADAWFQLHGYEPPKERDSDQVKNLAKLKCPVYMWAPHPKIPNSIAYPLVEIMDHFDIYGEGVAPEVVDKRDRVYFTNTISWILALAIWQGFKEIHVFGVNMAQNNGPGGEYAAQRPSCEFFLGWARGAGIKVYLPTVSDLLMGYHLYGLDEGRKMFRKYLRRIEELETRINEVRNQRHFHQNQAQQFLNTEQALLGARENTDYLYHLGPGNVRGGDDVHGSQAAETDK